MQVQHTLLLLTTLPLLLLAGCGDDGDESAGGEGEVTVTLYGEDFVEVGIPAEEVSDGWEIVFDRFEVTVDNVTVGGSAFTTSGAVDIAVGTDGAGHEVATATVPAGDHTDSSFAITAVALSGSANKDGVTKTFNWTFDHTTHYDACETTTSVTANGAATFQITVHADHLFYDSLVSEDPALVFQELADADADDDGELTRAELEAAGIGSLDPGSAGGVEDLWAWLVAQSTTLGHVDGEGHCDSHAQN